MDVFKAIATQCTHWISSTISGLSSTDCFTFSNVHVAHLWIKEDLIYKVCAKRLGLIVSVTVVKHIWQDLQYTITRNFSIQDGGGTCSYQL